MTHHIKANNPSVPDYNPQEPNSYITYLDINNLYGWALKQKLPTHNFQWVDMWDYEKVVNEVLAGSEEKGYVLEVDLIYPEHLHDDHDDYLLAPEKLAIDVKQLSPYQHQLIDLLQEQGRKRISTEN